MLLSASREGISFAGRRWCRYYLHAHLRRKASALWDGWPHPRVKFQELEDCKPMRVKTGSLMVACGLAVVTFAPMDAGACPPSDTKQVAVVQAVDAQSPSSC